ncbi:MAG: hypothetical protein LBH40_00055 [Alphaproteobacteria bacterium]|jgi:acid phosphatase|nr:hypothetical protein [Alphaproteobacteria bacterium]
MEKNIKIFLKAIFLLLVFSGYSVAQEEVNIYERPDIYWFQVSNEYENVSKSLYKLAKIQLDENLRDNKNSAYLEQKNNFLALPPAIILDIDDTILNSSNFSAFLAANHQEYSDKLWKEYVDKAIGLAVPGSVDFIKYALDKKITVFLVSNRTQEDYDATLTNLKRIGVNYPNMDKQIMLIGGKENWDSNKYNRYDEIAEKYRIVLIVGDNITDFLPSFVKGASYKEYKAINKRYKNYFEKYWVVLPNPLYGSWQEIKDMSKNLKVADLK